MKNFAIILLAFIAAFFCNEMIVRYVIHYPAMNASKRVYGMRDSERGIQRLRKPYAEYCNIENGYTILHYNNFGMPGRNIDTSGKRINIFVLGSSYIEALQTPANDMAVAVLQDSIERFNRSYQAINLGNSGYDPYDLYFKTKYLEKFFRPDYIVLVLDQTYSIWFDRHKNGFSFALPGNFMQEVRSTPNKIEFFARNNFHSLNLFREIMVSGQNNENAAESETSASAPALAVKEDLSRLYICLAKFQELYGDKFVCVSIIPDRISNEDITQYCRDHSIHFVYDASLKVPENQIKGRGHLTIHGNKLLGNLLYETFKTFYIR